MGSCASGSKAGGGHSTGINPKNIVDVQDMLTERGNYTGGEIDLAYQPIIEIYDIYGLQVDTQIATLKGKDSNVLGYADSNGNIAINKAYMNNEKMNATYKKCVDMGYHPSNGNKSGIEAVMAHELGHQLTAKIAGGNWAQFDSTANDVVSKASKKLGKTIKKGNISGYAKENSGETIAEAFSDVYCNGNKAKRESRAIVNVMNEMLGVKGI